ncbi:hypothetical protein B0O99DRAFT_590601 [Bisporella sp. PMI_857]|nr:hypothetical protein B0O99DRAFT_590601 [Bisporella sp. PMI_857]
MDLGNSRASMAPNKWASPMDWERVKPIIRELYVDEGKTLKEVMGIMERDYGHRGTKKMYVTRVLKWGYDKNNKKDDMMFILHKQTKRAAMSKQTEFVIRGRVLSEDDVAQYFSRRKGGVPDSSELPIEARTPEHISYRTPSPQPQETNSLAQHTYLRHNRSPVPFLPNDSRVMSSEGDHPSASHEGALSHGLPSNYAISYLGANDVRRIFSINIDLPHQPASPRSFSVSEELFYSIRNYFDGSFDSGSWTIDADGNCISTRRQATDHISAWIDYCRTASALIESKSFLEARIMLSNACALIQPMLEHEDPRTLRGLVEGFLHLKRKGHDQVIAILMKYISEMATIVTRTRNDRPLSKICRLLGMVDTQQFEGAMVQSWSCVSHTFQRNLGLFNQEALSCYLDYLQFTYSPFGTTDFTTEEFMLRQLLGQSRQVFQHQYQIPAVLKFNLGINLWRQGKFDEPEILGNQIREDAYTLYRSEEVYSRAGIEGPYYEDFLDRPSLSKAELLGFYVSCLAQHGAGKQDLADRNLRAAINNIVKRYGKKYPWATQKRLQLESWLREWGRHADADLLRLEIDELAEQNDDDDGLEPLTE